MEAHCSIPAWRIPRTEEPGGLQCLGLQGSDTTARPGRTQGCPPSFCGMAALPFADTIPALCSALHCPCRRQLLRLPEHLPSGVGLANGESGAGDWKVGGREKPGAFSFPVLCELWHISRSTQAPLRPQLLHRWAAMVPAPTGQCSPRLRSCHLLHLSLQIRSVQLLVSANL